MNTGKTTRTPAESQVRLRASGRLVEFDPNRPAPASRMLRLVCLECNDVMASKADTDVHCTCGNIHIEVSTGRLWVRDPASARWLLASLTELWRLAGKTG